MHDNSTACEPPLAVGQAKAEARAAAGVDDFLGGEAIPSQRAAFLELLKGRGVYDVDTAGMTLAFFITVSAISMPQTTAGSPCVALALSRRTWPGTPVLGEGYAAHVSH